ncbi:unnamed protein product [Chrysoparadoxa australica]
MAELIKTKLLVSVKQTHVMKEQAKEAEACQRALQQSRSSEAELKHQGEMLRSDLAKAITKLGGLKTNLKEEKEFRHRLEEQAKQLKSELKDVSNKLRHMTSQVALLEAAGSTALEQQKIGYEREISAFKTDKTEAQKRIYELEVDLKLLRLQLKAEGEGAKEMILVR